MSTSQKDFEATILFATQCLDRRLGMTTSQKDFEATIPSMHDVTSYNYPTKKSTIDAESITRVLPEIVSPWLNQAVNVPFRQLRGSPICLAVLDAALRKRVMETRPKEQKPGLALFQGERNGNAPGISCLVCCYQIILIEIFGNGGGEERSTTAELRHSIRRL